MLFKPVFTACINRTINDYNKISVRTTAAARDNLIDAAKEISGSWVKED